MHRNDSTIPASPSKKVKSRTRGEAGATAILQSHPNKTESQSCGVAAPARSGRTANARAQEQTSPWPPAGCDTEVPRGGGAHIYSARIYPTKPHVFQNPTAIATSHIHPTTTPPPPRIECPRLTWRGPCPTSGHLPTDAYLLAIVARAISDTPSR